MSAKKASGMISSPTFILGPLFISEANRARKLKFVLLVGIFSGTRAPYKNLSASGRLRD